MRSGIDTASFDPKVRPQDDLFRHVNGGWIKRVEIPADRALYGSFVQLLEKSEADLRAILEEAARGEAPEGSDLRKIGDLFASFMDEDRAERLGIDPIKDDLAKIDEVHDKAGLVRHMALLQRDGIGGLFRAFVRTDDKRSDRYIVNLNQGGIGLPDESYYREAKFKPIREKYVAHIEKTLTLAGLASPKEAAGRIMAVETELASHHLDRVKNRDRTLTYNKKDRKELETLTPGIDWEAWLQAYGARGQEVAEVIVRQPNFFAGLARMLERARA